VFVVPAQATGEELEQWWAELFERLAPDVDTPSAGDVSHIDATKRVKPLERVFEVAREHSCKTVVVEEEYWDSDHRSEYSVFWSKRFEPKTRNTKRLHFFKAELHARQLHALPGECGYIGYCIVRPTPLGPVGRTLLTPPPRLHRAVLTVITETPSFFGQALEVTGVPFCQQDGEAVVCAHTAAWLCHYIAYKRGIIPRRTTAEIAQLPSPEGSGHRPFPANGLTVAQLQGLFSSLHLPACLYEVPNLPELPAEYSKKARMNDAAIYRERIFRIVCKYINSGFPVVVLSEEQEGHAFTLVGWKKKDSGICLISADDQYGPYEEIDDPMKKKDRGDWMTLMVPLPEAVLMTAEGAEIAARAAADFIKDQYDRMDGLEGEHARASEIYAIAKELRTLDGPISVRARLVDARRYKDAVGRQGRSDDVVRLLRLAHLPLWVWLVEFHRRDLRDGKELLPCVVGEYVVDATSHPDVPFVDLHSTASISVDIAESRRAPDGLNTTAAGAGEPWRSMIVDPDLFEMVWRVGVTAPTDVAA
jgi:hypothetical protein